MNKQASAITIPLRPTLIFTETAKDGSTRTTVKPAEIHFQKYDAARMSLENED